MSSNEIPMFTKSEAKAYQLKNVSPAATIAGTLVAVCLPVVYLLVCSWANVNGFIVLAALPVLGALIYYFFKHVLTQRIIVRLDDENIHIEYTSKPFTDNVYNHSVTLQDIVSYELTEYRRHSLTLHFRDNTQLTVSMGPFEQGNDFVELKEQILQVIESRNGSGATNPVERTDNTFEGKRGKRLAILLVALIIALLIGIFFFPDQHKTSDVVHASGYIFMMLGLLVYIYNARKQQKK